jgi:ferredoxin
MPTLTIDRRTVQVPSGKRLVLAIEDEGGVAIGHRCGGNARCTTCRVEFLRGEPETMTLAEHDKLVERDLSGRVRLSCQIVCDRDMEVVPRMTVDTEEIWAGNPGERPADEITPEPVWRRRDQFDGHL